MSCRFCDAPLARVFVDLGAQPLANSYLDEADLLLPETIYPLKVYVCEDCLLVQLPEAARPDEIFSDYAYFSSVSSSWVEHARRFAETAIERLGLGPESRVIEIASNDGYLLRHFVARGVAVLGIEPAANVAAVAQREGIRTETAFFSTAKAEELVGRGERADLLVGNNVLAHVPALNDFVAGLATVLAERGVLSLEFPHLLRLIEELQFDTIYHEHYSYFSFATARRILAHHGLEVFDVEELPTHGGSLRVWARHAADGSRPVTGRVGELLAREEAAGLLAPAGYTGFATRVRDVKRGFFRFLLAAGDEGRTVAGYGAPAKGNTFLSYCGVGPEMIAFTVDKSPAKQGKYLPGTRIPIRAPDALREAPPGYVVILPWNLREEIAAEMADLVAAGTRFVVAIPEVTVVGADG